MRMLIFLLLLVVALTAGITIACSHGGDDDDGFSENAALKQTQCDPGSICERSKECGMHTQIGACVSFYLDQGNCRNLAADIECECECMASDNGCDTFTSCQLACVELHC